MHLLKKILVVFAALVFIALLLGIRYAWQALPIISGYGAKNLASAVFIQHRNPDAVLKEDLAFFPISMGSFTVNPSDSSVTGSVWGLARKKAIYRKGLGCTLVNDFSEEEVRRQAYALPAPAAANPDTLPWPLGDRIADTLPADINRPRLQQAIARAMQARHNGKYAHTRAVVVVYNGQLVGEAYAPGFDRTTPMLGWSMTKSLTSALVGMLVTAGKLQVDAPAPVPEWKGTQKENITLKQLLQQTTGLDYEEDYGKPSEATNMLFRRGDMAAYTAKLPLRETPGTRFYYSSGNSNILSRTIRHAVGAQQYAAFPYTTLFHRIGMYSLVLEPDASGTFVGSSYSYATARDWARFGLLYYNRGKWNGEQLLPESWIQASLQPNTADPGREYGYQFWLNSPGEKDPAKRPFPSAPDDMFYTSGFGGQHVFVIPSRKLIVVRLGLYDMSSNQLLEEVMDAVR